MVKNCSEAGVLFARKKEAASVSHKQTNGQTFYFILVVCCRLPGPFPATLQSLWLFCTAECLPSHGGLLHYVHVGDRSWTGGNSAFCCVIASAPSVSLFLPLLLFLLLFRCVGLRVSGPGERSPPSSAPPHSLSGTESCCSSGKTCLPHKTSDCRAGMRNSPGGRRSPWPS